MTWLRRALIALALLSMVTACGEDDDDAASTTTAADAATTTTEATFTGAGSEQFCTQASQAEAELTRLAQSPPSAEATTDVFLSAAQALQSLAEIAPEEIKPDVTVLAGAYQDVSRDLEAAGPNTSQMPATIARRLTQSDVRMASARLQTYQEKVCGKPPATTTAPG
ncbi:MAG: hypothetical protein M3179_14845 [Actinomycetota bacterium]|nr:hypothetical protein [Actinomycetota bacterium]